MLKIMNIPKIPTGMRSAFLLIATLSLLSAEGSAQERSVSYIAQTQTPEMKREQNSTSGQNVYMMSSDSDTSISGYKFVVDGKVALDVKDAKYNIYIADIDKEITDADLAGSVDVNNKTFRFETNISNIKAGRIRALKPDGSLSPVWISVYFIPGFTLDLKINNGSFDIGNDPEYNFMATAWLNKDALAVLFENMGGARQSDSMENKYEEMMFAINSYKRLQASLQDEINKIRFMIGNSKKDKEKKDDLINGLIQKINQINAKIEDVIDQYAKSITH